jgi:hypothetical protein
MISRVHVLRERRGILVIPEDGKLLLCNRNLGASKLGNEHLVSLLDTHGDTLSIPVKRTGSDCKHLGLVELLDGSFGKKDAGGGLCLGLDTLY